MIVMDLEWNSGYDKTRLEEILQFGAVRLDAPGGRITDTFCAFVRPRVHKKMNRTAKALPELKAMLNAPQDFPAALYDFVKWCGDDTVFADWGGDDLTVLRQNCSFWRLPGPKVTRHLDLQAAFSMQVGVINNIALAHAVEYCGIPETFTFHNALNDAMYTALVSAYIRPDLFSLLDLGREARRFLFRPAFPPSVRRTGPYSAPPEALQSRGCRRQPCPLCGEPVWVRYWYPGRECYYTDLRCRRHGVFLTRLTLHYAGEAQWQALVDVPEVTPALLKDYDQALRTGPISCKARKRPRRRRDRRRRPGGAV